MIAIIHRHAETRRTLTDALADIGFGVQSFASGEEAITALQDCVPDLLVTDVSLGSGMNGFELGRRLRDINPETRAIYLSKFSNSVSPRHFGRNESMYANTYDLAHFVRFVLLEYLN